MAEKKKVKRKRRRQTADVNRVAPGSELKNQIHILKYMYQESKQSKTPRKFQIRELSEKTNLNDEKEVTRILYVLEGYKFVSPFPETDFTSNIWYLTEEGEKAVHVYENRN